MEKKPTINDTRVAHDCIAYALLVELKEVMYWRKRQQDALPMLADTMLRILEKEIPKETFSRMRENDFVSQMHHKFADCGAVPYTAFQILNAS